MPIPLPPSAEPALVHEVAGHRLTIQRHGPLAAAGPALVASSAAVATAVSVVRMARPFLAGGMNDAHHAPRGSASDGCAFCHGPASL